VSEEVESITRL